MNLGAEKLQQGPVGSGKAVQVPRVFLVRVILRIAIVNAGGAVCGGEAAATWMER